MGRKRKNPYNKRDLIAALRKLNDFWPDGYWLLVADGGICLMRKTRNGARVMTAHGAYDQDAVADWLGGIEADGGDW